MEIKKLHEKLINLGFDFRQDGEFWNYNKEAKDFGWSIYLDVDPTRDEFVSITMFANGSNGQCDEFYPKGDLEKVFEVLNTYEYVPWVPKVFKFSIEGEVTVLDKKQVNNEIQNFVRKNPGKIQIREITSEKDKDN